MSIDDLKYVDVWQQPKEDYVDAIIDLWARNGVQFPPEVIKQRLAEMALVVFRGEELVAVSTLGKVPYLYKGVFMGYFRTLVDQSARAAGLAGRLAGRSADLLQDWSKENPDAGYMGFMIVLENKALSAGDVARQPTWPQSRTVLAGVNAHGQQVRIKWFPHATLPPLEPLQ